MHSSAVMYVCIQGVHGQCTLYTTSLVCTGAISGMQDTQPSFHGQLHGTGFQQASISLKSTLLAYHTMTVQHQLLDR